MAEEPEIRTYRWVLPLAVGIVYGGLGGAVFTWYMNRPKSTVVTYTIATTTIAAPESVTGLVPDLKVMIGPGQVKSLYTFNVELVPRKVPYLDRAEIGIEFPAGHLVHIYGSKIESPSTTNHIDCAQTGAGFLCTIYPLDTTHPRKYRITAATDQSQPPILTQPSKGVDLVPAEQFAPTQAIAWQFIGISTLGGFLALFSAEVFSLLRRLRGRK
jgi:hypothetical protein